MKNNGTFSVGYTTSTQYSSPAKVAVSLERLSDKANELLRLFPEIVVVGQAVFANAGASYHGAYIWVPVRVEDFEPESLMQAWSDWASKKHQDLRALESQLRRNKAALSPIINEKELLRQMTDIEKQREKGALIWKRLAARSDELRARLKTESDRLSVGTHLENRLRYQAKDWEAKSLEEKAVFFAAENLYKWEQE